MMRRQAGFLAFICILPTLGCAPEAPPPDPAVAAFDAAAESYVRLVLAVGRHDDDYVDAYYGPASWRAEAEAGEADALETLLDRVRALETDVEALALPAAAEGPWRLRQSYLARQLRAVGARIEMLLGARWSFDEESLALYDAVAPHHDGEFFEETLAEIDAELAAAGLSGDRIESYEAFRSRYVIPADRLAAVFDAAIAECRARTAAHTELPPGEGFVVEYVTDQPWSGYNWYQGGYQSLIQVNTDLPIYIDRAIDLACHEGYPGHHFYNSMLERSLVDARGWVEFTVYPLFSPQSLIAEGTANFGVEMAFPGEERTAFERDVLFPLAGLDPATADAYARMRDVVARLTYADNQAARLYLDGEMTAEEAAAWLAEYAAKSLERAGQRRRFIDRYRSYVINYNLGKDMARDYVDRVAGTEDAGARWRVFVELLSSPRLPSDLAGE